MVNGIPLGIALEVMKNNNEPGYELLVVHSFCALCYNSCLLLYCVFYRILLLLQGCRAPGSRPLLLVVRAVGKLFSLPGYV